MFPGGGREIAKFKGEQNTLRWQGRAGFARMAVEHNYPIVPAGLLGGDDVYRSLSSRGGRWEQLSLGVVQRLTGRAEMAIPLMHGIGPTLIPRPQRLYLGFAAPIETTKPARVSKDKWVATVRQKAKESLEEVLAELLDIRADDPYHNLNPLAWRTATPSPDGPLRIAHTT